MEADADPDFIVVEVATVAVLTFLVQLSGTALVMVSKEEFNSKLSARTCVSDNKRRKNPTKPAKTNLLTAV